LKINYKISMSKNTFKIYAKCVNKNNLKKKPKDVFEKVNNYFI